MNLIAAALLIRVRTASLGSVAQWRDTLALASVVLPLVALGEAVTQFALTGVATGWPSGSGWLVAVFYNGAAIGPLPTLLLAAAALLGWRRATLVAVAALAVAEVAYLGGHSLTYYPFLGPGDAANLSVLGIEALALIASPGPRRGRAALGARGCALATGAGALAGTAVMLGPVLTRPWGPSASVPVLSPLQQELAAGGAVVIIAVIMLARSGASRRLLAVLALPGCFFVVLNVMWTLGPLRTTLTYLPFAVLALAAAAWLLARRARGRPPSGGQGA